MIRDALNTFGEDQDLSQTTGTYTFSEVIDFGADHSRAIGTGTPKRIAFAVTEAFASGGAATVTFRAATSANADLSSPTVVAATGAFGYADLTDGKVVELTLPEGVEVGRYFGVQAVIGGATTTAGTVTAFVVS